MPELQARKKPAAITHALKAIERYQQQFDGSLDIDYVPWLKKTLPALAMGLSNSDETVDADLLLRHAEKGQAHIEHLLIQLKSSTAKPKQAPLSYDEVVNALPKKSDDRSELERLIDKNDPAKIIALINDGASIHARDGLTLCWSAEKGHYDVVQRLIENDVDIHGDYQYALSLAASNGHYGVVELLIKNGVNIHAEDDSAFREAAKGGHYDVVELLIKNKANIHASGENALIWAVINGHYEVAKLLVESEADIHVDNDIVQRLAASGGHIELVKLLIKYNIDVHVDNDSMLCGAAQYGHIDVVRLLMGHGADIHASGDSALILSAGNGHSNIVQLLLDNNANIHAEDDRALGLASNSGHYDAVKLLIENDAHIRADDDYALRCAVKNGHYGVAELLVQADGTLDEEYLTQNDGYKKHKAWQRLHNDFKIPKILLDKNPYDFKLKTYVAVESMLSKEGYKGQTAAKYVYNISTLFRTEDRVLRYLQKWGEAGRQPLHDCAQFINIPDAGDIDYKSWGDAILQHGPQMARFVKFADRLAQPEKTACGKNWSLTATRSQAAQFVYEGAVKYPDLASACFAFSWDEPEFKDAVKQIKKYKKLFAENDMKKTQARLPAIKIDGAEFGKPEYHFYELPDGDMRGLLLGEFTNCCQHLANQGADCAKHGFLSEEGGFYVIAHKKTDQIIGQSWAWRGVKDELVFDSLESLSGHFNAKNWEKITSKFAEQIKQDNTAQISALNIGKGGATPSLSFKKAATLARPIDYKSYRDSKNTQYVVADFKPA